MANAYTTVTRYAAFRLRFRIEAFDQIMDELAIRSDAAKAKFLGIHQSQYTRAKNGTVQPSEVFITQVLTALPDSTFEDLFEIVEVAA